MEKQSLKDELCRLQSKYRGPFGPAGGFIKPGSPQWRIDSDRMEVLIELLGQNIWQRRFCDAHSVTGISEKKHKELVEKSFKQGRYIPEAVLIDYQYFKETAHQETQA